MSEGPRARAATAARAGIVFVLSATLSLSVAAAEPGDGSTIVLAPLVVSATRVPTPADRLGSAVTVIDRAAIEASGATSVEALLRRVAGVTVVNSGGLGARTDVSIRGADEDQTLVLIDGVRVNDPASTGGRFDFAGLSVQGIERIEVLRGAQSALYGGEAIGGVINIVTRRADEGVGGYVGLGGGSYGTFRQETGFGARREGWDLTLDAVNQTAEGFSRSKDGDEKDGAKLRTLSGHGGYEASERLRFDAAARYEDVFAELDPTATRDGFADKHDRVWSGRLGAELALLDGAWTQHLDLYGSRTLRRFEDESTAGVRTVSDFDGARAGLEWRHDLAFDDANQLTLGVDVHRDYGQARERSAGASRERYDRDEDAYAAYGLYSLELFDRLNLTAGGRFDDFEAFGTEFTYRLTAALPITETDTVLRASHATGAKAPTIQQRFDDTFLFGFLPVRGNPDLGVERSRSWDVGVEQTLFNRMAVASATLFRNDFDDLIEYDAGAGTFLQLDEATTEGVELGLKVTPTDRVTLTGSYTFMTTEDQSDGSELARRPRHAGSVVADVSLTDRLSFQASASHIGRRYNQSGERGRLDAYTLVGLAARYALLDGLELHGRIDNLFDADYEEAENLATPGRSVFAGLRATF